jgi:ATP-dependent helicase/nuclease subunit A
MGPWLETLEAPWLSPPDGATHMQLPSGQAIHLLAADLDPEPKEAVAISRLPLQWFVDPPRRAKRLPRIFNPSAAQSPAMVIVESASIGMRMDIGSTAERTEVGHVVHGAMALAFADLSVPVRVADVSRIVSAYAMSANMSDVALTAQVNALRAWVTERWPSSVSLPEWPVESVMSNGQVLNGRIDLLLDVGDGWILIDHKTSSGGHARWPELANEYGGQLLAYKDAVEAASGKPVKELWLTLPVAGAAIRVEPA